jgi:hypothetical protein
MAISRYVEAEGIFALLPKWRCVNDYHYYLKDALQSYRANAFYPYCHIPVTAKIKPNNRNEYGDHKLLGYFYPQETA